MSNYNLPILRQGQRNEQGFVQLLDDTSDAGTTDMKSEKGMLEVQVQEAPSGPVGVTVTWEGPDDPENPQNGARPDGPLTPMRNPFLHTSGCSQPSARKHNRAP